MAEFASSGFTPGLVGKGVGFSLVKPVEKKAPTTNLLRPLITEKRNVVPTHTKVDEKVKATTEKPVVTKPSIF
jgi:hypothetical protein